MLARAACAKVRAGIGDLVAEGKYFQRKLAHRRRHRRRRRKRIVQRLGRKTMKVTGIKEMERGPTCFSLVLAGGRIAGGKRNRTTLYECLP